MKGKWWRLMVGVLALAGGVGYWTTAQATSVKKEQTAIKKIIKRDLKPVGGKWSVKVTRLGKHPLSVRTGNQSITRQRSASTIKVFVMVTIFRRAKQHKLKLNSRDRQDLKLMIHNSDNAVANRLIRRAGGFKVVNQTIRHYHFKQTVLQRYMLDTHALRRGRDNYTSVNDLTRVLVNIYHHQLLGKTYDKQMLALLRGCRNHSKLPKLVKRATVYNKTGEYPDKGVQNDAAIFHTKRGTYSIVVMAQSGRQWQQYRGMNRLGRDVVNYLNHHR
ncbi:serine hydrolase [Lactiplantibacillus garii]|uniref:Serine hydrolase n=1 Tax=Lactiplantibacillus garii TaxID=2306423 RepID=A0A3R8J6S3_9LACO|nr:serine hydrolase [Lactiplantibacillus garii]RRK10380.1 serine hydrolase [Lactiplantibacillus garii]